MKINVITIFPDFFKDSTSFSILKRAQEKGLFELNIINLRDFSDDNYKTIDDKPYGGGPGMIMMLPPVYKALRSLKSPKNVILPSAKGTIWNQKMAQQFSTFDELTFVVPHFEGIDERVTQNLIDYEISIGPYVVSGGEIPVISMIDSIIRLIPGALGNPDSLNEESYNSVDSGEKTVDANSEYLEYPQYTRPSTFINEEGQNWSVPEVLLSGDHKKIKEWREKKS